MATHRYVPRDALMIPSAAGFDATADVKMPRPVRVQSRPITRGRVLQWLRVTHVWLGLWGALLGLLFGLTGFLMNHRAVMKIAVQRSEASQVQVTVPSAFTSADELTVWLRGRMAMPTARPIVRIEPASIAQFMGQEMSQPERWSVTLSTPKISVSAKHIPGSGVVDLETQDATAWGVLMRLHMASGASAGWILLADTIAGALMILALSGVLLWSKLRAPRLAGAAVFLAAPFAAAIYLAMY